MYLAVLNICWHYRVNWLFYLFYPFYFYLSGPSFAAWNLAPKGQGSSNKNFRDWPTLRDLFVWHIQSKGMFSVAPSIFSLRAKSLTTLITFSQLLISAFANQFPRHLHRRPVLKKLWWLVCMGAPTATCGASTRQYLAFPIATLPATLFLPKWAWMPKPMQSNIAGTKKTGTDIFIWLV